MDNAVISTRRKAGNMLVWVGHPAARNIPILAIGFWFVWLLAGRLQSYDLALLVQYFSEISPQQWALALAVTSISFLAVAGYDVLATRAVGMPVPLGDALKIGFVATALAQLIGLGLATGALVRWRMLGGAHFSLWQASVLTISVTTGFLLASMFFAAVTSLLWLGLGPLATMAGLATLLGFGGLVLASITRPEISIAGRRLQLPKLRLVFGFIALAIVDLGGAALAFWLILPAEMAVGFTVILPIFVLATGAGILSGVPGGVGPFELTCLALMPMHGQEPLLAAILGFRVVYYLVPGIAAFAMFLWAEWSRSGVLPVPTQIKDATRQRQLPFAIAERVAKAQRAEARLIHSGDFGYLSNEQNSGHFLVAEAGNSLIALSDPVAERRDWPALIARLKIEAQMRNTQPVIYKCSGEVAELARKAGYRVCRIGQEAVLDPQEFTLNGAAMRSMRRKLRQAEAANIRVECVENEVLPLAQMQIVSRQWVARRGGERGFSMGRFSPATTQQHRHFLAWQGGRLVGFIGLWQTEGETALDLMRTSDDAPTGVMQALVCAAIQDAASAGIARFSLASVPFLPLAATPNLSERLCDWLWRKRAGWHGGQGLYQFKQGFRPNWEPRYLATSGLIPAAIAGVDIARSVAAGKVSPRRQKPG